MIKKYDCEEARTGESFSAESLASISCLIMKDKFLSFASDYV